MIRMETTDIVIHKGEKEEKYQLYVEDYVMSYLKNYADGRDGRKIFFYGTREQKNKKYYIYGAGRQKNISYFVRYELLDEIVCRFDMDMPVFSIKEDSKRYQLKGYYIFYQTNEAMQSYMVEQRNENESVEKEQDKFKAQSRGASQFGNMSQSNTLTQSKIRPQDFSDIRMRSGIKTSEEKQKDSNNSTITNRTDVRNKEKDPNKIKGGLLAFQLAAVFLVLAAIIINSTNSYSKLRELGQSAVEVFFTMENQEASQRTDGEVSDSSAILEASDSSKTSNATDVSEESGETILRLEDLDAEFEKENQYAKQDETEDDASDAENQDGENELSEVDQISNSKNEVNEDEEINNNMNAGNNNENNTGEDNQNNNNKNEINEDTNNSEESNGEDDTNDETPQSQEAFARNLTEYYQIEKGDTLNNISIKKYGDASKVKEICEINKIEDPDNIKYGQKIILP